MSNATAVYLLDTVLGQLYSRTLLFTMLPAAQQGCQDFQTALEFRLYHDWHDMAIMPDSQW